MTIPKILTPEQEAIKKIANEIKKRVRVAYDEDGYQTSDSKAERFDRAVESNTARTFDEVEREVESKIRELPYDEKLDWQDAEQECKALSKAISDEANEMFKDAKGKGVAIDKIMPTHYDKRARDIEVKHKDKCAVTYPSLGSAFSLNE